MIIGISGKIGSGKDTIGSIIQYLTLIDKFKDNTFVTLGNLPINISKISYEEYTQIDNQLKYKDQFEIHKFTDSIKYMVCVLINCTRKQLENHKFKNTELGKEWWYYKVSGNRFYQINMIPYLGNDLKQSDKDSLILYKHTPRSLLQLLGTQCGRGILHPNIWINSLMSKYKAKGTDDKGFITKRGFNGSITSWIPMPLTEPEMYPNWIITDLRFENEKKAIEDRQGICIRVERRKERQMFLQNATTIIDTRKVEHESETALDNHTFDETIINDGLIEDLIEKVKEILIRRNILTIK